MRSKAGRLRAYRFRPVLCDWLGPMAIRGRHIEIGSLVIIIGEVGDPLRKFVYIRDEQGNEESVHRTSLWPICDSLREYRTPKTRRRS